MLLSHFLLLPISLLPNVVGTKRRLCKFSRVHPLKFPSGLYTGANYALGIMILDPLDSVGQFFSKLFACDLHMKWISCFPCMLVHPSSKFASRWILLLRRTLKWVIFQLRERSVTSASASPPKKASSPRSMSWRLTTKVNWPVGGTASNSTSSIKVTTPSLSSSLCGVMTLFLSAVMWQQACDAKLPIPEPSPPRNRALSRGSQFWDNGKTCSVI